MCVGRAVDEPPAALIGVGVVLAASGAVRDEVSGHDHGSERSRVTLEQGSYSVLEAGAVANVEEP